MLRNNWTDSFIKMLLVAMVLIEKIFEKDGKQPKKISVNLPGKPPRDPIEGRRLLSKLRKIVQGEELGLEKLASLEHDQWVGWMRHIFEKCYLSSGGSLIIPPHLVTRWQRQMKTPYSNLPPEEQEPDRAEARRVLSLKWLEEPQNDSSSHGL